MERSQRELLKAEGIVVVPPPGYRRMGAIGEEHTIFTFCALNVAFPVSASPAY